MRIAIIEPNPVSAQVLAHAAERRGHQAVCFGGPERLSSNLPFEPSVVLLATERIERSALGAVSAIRKALPSAIVIVVAERGSGSGLSLAMRAGATDVTGSPYDPHELLLRAEIWDAAMHSAPGQQTALALADLEVDLGKYLALKNRETLLLTKLELRLLYCLMEHHPHLAPLERLLSFGWDVLSSPDASLIKTHMSHLRRKLRDAGGISLDIQSRQTVGYILSVEPDERRAGPEAVDAQALQGVA